MAVFGKEDWVDALIFLWNIKNALSDYIFSLTKKKDSNIVMIQSFPYEPTFRHFVLLNPFIVAIFLS
jgi:hypothetical protein